MIPDSFRDTPVPNYINNKTQLVAWALETFMNDEPITNWEFVRELNCHRFGGIIFNLREQGYNITTLKSKRKKGLVMYYCSSVPSRASSSTT